jgi:hypothetical protein
MALLLLLGCNKKEYINVYDKNISNTKISCLEIDESSQSDLIKKLKPLYNFSDNCQYKISISSRKNIVCNSSFNAPQKTTTNFPSAYLRLELKSKMKLIFSYYVDLTSPPNDSDVERAFEVLKEYVDLSSKE